MNFWNFISQNRLEIADLALEHLWMVGISTLLALAVVGTFFGNNRR